MYKLLIANRGEIACRIIQTAKKLNWQTVAVYSSADKHALHVSLADEAYLIGDPPPSDSYLNQERILEVAVEAEVTAIHPGYGFLSENAEFATSCKQQDVIFVGPPSAAIELMGLKGAARQQMQEAGIPVLPGINEITNEAPIEEITKIGLPVLIKPEAGGGGKGMKIVYKEHELEDALVSARREALSAFGNDSLMVEKYLVQPRHIEIQIFSDQSGQCVHLNERDCSLQRRHQKIIEESPAPGLSEELRQEMGQAAVAAAKAVNYIGAGTVEFLLGEDGQFFFMEMNTRLQVEHPVTEMITGIDLVEWQLLIAMGKELPLHQDEISINGHAIEVRLYAEDPLNEFLPVSGRISDLQLPAATDKIRIDSGISNNEHIGVFYDPMLMKLIAWDTDRTGCIQRLATAISNVHIAGIRTNRDFLHQLVTHKPFHAGGLGTDYLDRYLAKVLTPLQTSELHHGICAAVCFLIGVDSRSPWQALTSFRMIGPSITHCTLRAESETFDIRIEKIGELLGLSFSGCSYICNSLVEDPVVKLSVDQKTRQYHIHRQGDRITLFDRSRTIELVIPNEDAAQSEEEGSLQAPMAGKIVSILVSEGEHVTRGTKLAIIEAMKMEHSLSAPTDGRIVKVLFAESDLVDEGIKLFEFESEIT